MTHEPSTHYCNQREILISLDQTLRSCISANQSYSDDPCPHAQDFQARSSTQVAGDLGAGHQTARTLMPDPAE